MHDHIVRSYDQELSLLDGRIAEMGGMAERLLADAFEALEKRDPELARSAVASDAGIDRIEQQLQEQASP
jgi:Phosphate uptake regulator